MRYTDSRRLKARIIYKGYTMVEFCKLSGITAPRLYRRLNGKCDFKQSEIAKIVDLLEIENPDEYFFAKTVS